MATPICKHQVTVFCVWRRTALLPRWTELTYAQFLPFHPCVEIINKLHLEMLADVTERLAAGREGPQPLDNLFMHNLLQMNECCMKLTAFLTQHGVLSV